jgi:hypothetical protein
VEGSGGDGRVQTEVTTLTSRASGPFGPSSISYSTFAPSARLLKPGHGVVSIKWREPASLRIFKWSGGQAGWRFA